MKKPECSDGNDVRFPFSLDASPKSVCRRALEANLNTLNTLINQEVLSTETQPERLEKLLSARQTFSDYRERFGTGETGTAPAVAPRPEPAAAPAPQPESTNGKPVTKAKGTISFLQKKQETFRVVGKVGEEGKRIRQVIAENVQKAAAKGAFQNTEDMLKFKREAILKGMTSLAGKPAEKASREMLEKELDVVERMLKRPEQDKAASPEENAAPSPPQAKTPAATGGVKRNIHTDLRALKDELG